MRNIILSKIFLLIVFLTGFNSSTFATVNVGDIAVIGVNADVTPAEIALVTLAPIASGEVIYISDYAWDGSIFTASTTNNLTAEGVVTWTTTSPIPAGTVIKVSITPGSPATVVMSSGIATAASWSNLIIGQGGDSWLIYQGAPLTPTNWIYGFANWSANITIPAPRPTYSWATSAPTTTTSCLPAALTNGYTANALTGNTITLPTAHEPHYDNLVYIGAKSGTKSALLTAIATPSNWQGDESVIKDINPGGANFAGANPIFSVVLPNSAPTDIALSASSINENVSANSVIGNLSSTDPDAGNTFTYSLVAGTGSSDNASFNISGGNLQISNSPDYETKNSYSVRVRTTDQGGLIAEKVFVVSINDLNEAPSDIALSASAINENVVANSIVGTLSSIDPDAVNTFTYTLVAGAGSTDNGAFNISGNGLRITSSPDFETKSSYSIRVKTTDQGGILYFEKAFTVTINDVSEAPKATSLAASGITATTATLNGTVNANNASTIVTFEYGLTNAYGSVASGTPSPVTGVANTSITGTVAGLIPNQTYHFRIVASNATGTTNGIDQTITTNAAAPTITSFAPTAVTITGATLQGTAIAMNSSTVVSFEYGLTTSYGSSVTADQSPIAGVSPVSFSKAISGLTVNTVYHYRAVGVNAGGTTYGVDISFSTATAVPDAPTGVVATVQANQVLVAFVPPVFTGGLSVTNYEVTVLPGGTKKYGTSSPIIVTGLTNGNSYTFTVAAINSKGTSVPSAPSAAVTAATVPDAPTAVSAVAGNTQATISFTAPVSNGGSTITGYTVTSSPGGLTASGLGSPITVTGLTNGTAYTFSVKATNSVGSSLASVSSLPVTPALAPLATTNGLTSLMATSGTLNASVNARNASSVVTFEYGLTNAYGTTVTADQSPVTGNLATPITKTITGLSIYTTYHYRVVAVNAMGTTYGLDQSFTTLAVSPVATTGSASSITTTSAVVNGMATANNTSTVVTFEFGPTISYGFSAPATPSPLLGMTNTAVSGSIIGLTPNSTYHYRIKAANIQGTTTGSDQIFTTSAAAPTITTNPASLLTIGGATFNGRAFSNNAPTTVTFEYGLTTSYGTSVVASQSPINSASLVDVSASVTGLAINTTYHFRAVAVNAGGTTYGLDDSFTTPATAPDAPTSVTAVPGLDKVTVSFTPPSNTGGLAISSYTVTSSPGNISTIGYAGSPIIVTGLTNGTNYTFSVTATNSMGTSTGSLMSNSAAPFHATSNYIGTDNWSVAANWDSGIPGFGTTVAISGDVTLGSTTTVKAITINAGSSLTVNAGQTLTVTNGIYNNGTITNNGTIVGAIVVSIVFDENGGSLVSDLLQDFNTAVTLPVPTKNGYNFEGWFSDIALNTPFTATTMPINGVTLYAKWQLATGIETSEQDASSISPNPAINEIIVNAGSQPAQLSIYSLTGELVLSQEVSGATTINISTLSQGTYLVKINGQTTKLIKM